MCYECAPICVAGIEARADNGVFFHQLVDLAVHQRRLTLLLCDGFGIRHGPLHKIRVHSDLDAVGMLSAIHFYTFAIIHTFPFGKRPGHPERYPARSFAIQLVACVVFLNTLLYPHGSARTGEGSAAVRGCKLLCEFLIHRGFIGVGYDGGRNVRDEERRLNSKSGWKPWKPALRSKSESEEASGPWRPTKRQVLWAIGMVVALLTTALLIVNLYPEIWKGLLEERTLKLIAIGVSLSAIIVLLTIGGAASSWTGFRRKTVWDLLQLLVVPLALAVIGLWFAAQQDARQQQTENQRAEAE